MSEHLATKQDLQLLRKDVEGLRKDMDAGFALVRQEAGALHELSSHWLGPHSTVDETCRLQMYDTRVA